MTTRSQVTVKKTGASTIPPELIREIIDGEPVYYKGYRDVLSKKKSIEEVMADGVFQLVMKMWLSQLLYSRLNRQDYWVFSGEAGMHISKNNNTSNDIIVFEKAKLPLSKVSNQFADVPAKLVIEIDTAIEYGTGIDTETYIHRKTQNMLDFGVEKVIWVFSATRKVMVAEPDKDWITADWSKTIAVLEGIHINVAAFLEEEGITPP